MKTAKISGNETRSFMKSNIAAAAESAGLTVGLNLMFCSPEVRASLINSLKGEDRFIKSSVKAAEKTAAKTGVKVDLAKVAQNAKDVFPAMKFAAKNTAKQLGKAAATVAAIVFVGNTISEKIINSRKDKNN